MLCLRLVPSFFGGVALSFSHESLWLLLKGVGAQMKFVIYGCCTAAYSRDETTVLEAMDLVHPYLRSIADSLASRVPRARPQCIIEETLLTDAFMSYLYHVSLGTAEAAWIGTDSTMSSVWTTYGELARPLRATPETPLCTFVRCL